MTLKEFVEKFVCRNTLIRLWRPTVVGHMLLRSDEGKEVAMEWQLLKGEGWQAKHRECRVIGVTDIMCDTHFEAVNIVIEAKEKDS